MRSLLFVTNNFRSVNKILPIIPGLSECFDIDMFNIFEMSDECMWAGSDDPRPRMRDEYSPFIRKFISGPSYDQMQGPNDPIFRKKIDYGAYNVILFDDNRCKSTWGSPSISKFVRKANKDAIIVGSPHGNYEFGRNHILKNINTILHYSFVFGDKEKEACKNHDRLFGGGMPCNDKLIEYPRKDEYILVIPNFTFRNKRFKFMTEADLAAAQVFELSKKYDLPIVIKEKVRYAKRLKSVLYEQLKRERNVEFVFDLYDDTELIMGAKFVIGAPSTMSFKPIQAGIPTVLLSEYGQIGNFEGFSGLVSIHQPAVVRQKRKRRRKRKSVIGELERQAESGRDEKFIKHVLTGGWEYNSTEIYIDTIKKLAGIEDE